MFHGTSGYFSVCYLKFDNSYLIVLFFQFYLHPLFFGSILLYFSERIGGDIGVITATDYYLLKVFQRIWNCIFFYQNSLLNQILVVVAFGFLSSVIIFY